MFMYVVAVQTHDRVP